MVPFIEKDDSTMHIEINRESKAPIYLQIKKQISSMIISGTLPANHILPSERRLAEKLNVNRSTVIKAYMELKSEGFVESCIGKGTTVLPQLSKDEMHEKTYIPSLRWNQLESRLIPPDHDPLINKILSVFKNEDIISFASGMPSKDTYPVDLLRDLQTQIIEKYREKLFLPTNISGCIELKNAVKDILKNRNINTCTKQIMITSGSQQAIDFFGKLLIEQGDIVIVEEPTYIGAIQAFESYGARLIGIPMEQDGMKLDILESCLLKYRPKFIYTQPTFQNPSGITMSLEKRKKLLQLAYYHHIPILEDDPYGEVRFEGNLLPALKSLDLHGYVTYLSTFSKTISFSLRVGFMIGSEHVVNRFIQFKQLTDIQTNTQAQYLLSEFIHQGYYEPHIKFIKERYKNKRNLMIDEFTRNKVKGLELILPEGGYFIWCKLPDSVRLSQLLDHLAAQKVVVMPGESFFPNKGIDRTYIRLNFSYPNEKEIVEGVKRFIKAIHLSCVAPQNSGPLFSSTINPFL